MNKVTLQPAFVLHTRPYRDTSLLVELLTVQHGRLTVVARGARGPKSKLRGIVTLFLPLLISFSGKTDLKTLQHVEANGLSYSLQDKSLLSALYLNELLIKLLPSHEAYPEVYHCYQKTLKALLKPKFSEVELRLFEKKLLAELGYGLQLDCLACGSPILPDDKCMFEFGRGLIKAEAEHAAYFLGKNLLALHEENLCSEIELKEAKRLLRLVIANLLGNKNIKSRELFIV